MIVLYEKGWLIGEMTVSAYIYIDKPPRTEVEKNLYRLVTYPVTIDEDPVVFDTWLKGHIILRPAGELRHPGSLHVARRFPEPGLRRAANDQGRKRLVKVTS